MSDGEVLPPTVPFTRGCKARASLPVGWSSGQTRERLPGVLYLQYGEETKQVRMPAEISSQDALQALFVTAFPHQLTIKMLQSPNMAIYIKDTSRNVYYHLEDIRNITSHSCLKVYHKDPTHVFKRYARPANTEISKEVLYGNHSPVHSLSSSSRGTMHSLQGSMSPPMVRSMPSSPSRMAYGGGNTGRGAGLVDPGSATLPRERLSGAVRSSAVCTNSSSILERRDVKPDEDAGSSKSMALVVRGEGGPHYPDSYCSIPQDGGGRLSIASSQCSAPPSLTADIVDAGVTGIPGGLQQYRASIKPLTGYGESMEHQTRSLHRQKSRKYGESQLPPLGTKTPPSSPQRVSEVRMADGQIIGGVALVPPERMSPIRRSLRRDSNVVTVEVVNRSRGSCSSSSTSSVFVDSPLGQPERLFEGHMSANNAQSERMKAMEEQIASLAGLVHHALSMGPDLPGVKEAVSETAGLKIPLHRPGVSAEPQNTAALIDSISPTPLALQTPPSGSGLRPSLVLAQRKVCELRLQLNQLRHLQLSNQESVSSMLRMAGQELVVLMCNRLAQSEEAACRQRAAMEEERMHYLATEEKIIIQLSELEDYVERLQRSSTSSPGQVSITLRDVEEGAVNLRRVGEALAILKGEFPELQVKMRSVLRLEVEAVRFLKEEPHKMDSMLKRVRALTETLSSLHRCVSESTPQARSAQVEPLKVLEAEQGPLKTQSPQSSPKPQPRSSVRPPLPLVPLSGSQADVSLRGSASPIMTRRMKSAAATVNQPSHHHPSPPLTPTHGRDSPTVAKVSPRSREGSPALQKGSPLQSDGSRKPAPVPTQESTIKHTETHTETTERQTPEGRLSGETSSMDQPSSSQANQSASTDSSQPTPYPNTNTKSIPELNVSDTREGQCNSASGEISSTASKSEPDGPLELTSQASVEPDAQEDTPPKLTEGADSTQLKPPDTASSMESPPSAAPSAPPSSSHSIERSSRPQMEKPRRSSVEKEMKQSPDRAHKSPPPPPPPRRFHCVSSGVTTGRSGEVIFISKKEPVGAQDADEKDKEPPVIPQPKPPRQASEVKPKPQICTPAPVPGSTSTPATASAHREEEEEEEDNKFMKELQVTTELSNKIDLLCGNKQWKGEVKAFPASQVASQSPSVLTPSAHQSVPQQGMTDGRPHKLITAVGEKKLSEDSVSPDEEKEAEEKVVKQVTSLKFATVEKAEVTPPVALQYVQTDEKNEEGPTPTQKKAEKIDGLTNTASQKENDLTVNSHGQIDREVIGQVCSPTKAEKKVKLTTIVTLQKENIQATDITSPDQMNENIVQEVPAEKKSNLTVVQKGNTPEHDCSMKFLQDKSLRSDQECMASTSVLKFTHLSPQLTYSHSSKQQNKEATVQESRNQSQPYSEEGGSLSPNIWEDEGPPPPPPPTGKINLRICKTRGRTQSKEEDLTKTSSDGSDGRTVSRDSTGEPTYLAFLNQGFEDSGDFEKPVILILNEPMEIQSAYKRLSTIFESEECLDGILSPEDLVDEEETKKEEKDDVRNICITEINTGLGFKDIPGNGQNSLQHQRPSAENGSILESQDKGQPDSLTKAETKRKFKFKFPKNKLAAISQAIRTGTTKTGKKTLEVVVYEKEEEIASDSRPVKETKKQTKECKSFEINSTKQLNLGEGDACDRDIRVSSPSDTRHPKSTFDSTGCLEESIRHLEIRVNSVTAPSPQSSVVSSAPQSPGCSRGSIDRAQIKSKVKRERERSPSKRKAPQILKGPNPTQSKRAKPQPPHNTGKSSTMKQTSSSSASSSAQQSHSKPRHAASSGSLEKTPRSQQQASQPHLVIIPR